MWYKLFCAHISIITLPKHGDLVDSGLIFISFCVQSPFRSVCRLFYTWGMKIIPALHLLSQMVPCPHWNSIPLSTIFHEIILSMGVAESTPWVPIHQNEFWGQRVWLGHTWKQLKPTKLFPDLWYLECRKYQDLVPVCKSPATSTLLATSSSSEVFV